MRILGLEQPFSHTKCNARYAHLMKANSSAGGSLYIKNKVMLAKKVLDKQFGTKE